MPRRWLAMLTMMLSAAFVQPSHAYGRGHADAVAGGVIAGLVGGVLLNSAIGGRPMYAVPQPVYVPPPAYVPPPMYGAPVPVYAPPPYYYAGPRCYWRNEQEWVGYGWALIPRQVCY